MGWRAVKGPRTENSVIPGPVLYSLWLHFSIYLLSTVEGSSTGNKTQSPPLGSSLGNKYLGYFEKIRECCWRPQEGASYYLCTCFCYSQSQVGFLSALASGPSLSFQRGINSFLCLQHLTLHIGGAQVVEWMNEPGNFLCCGPKRPPCQSSLQSLLKGHSVYLQPSLLSFWLHRLLYRTYYIPGIILSYLQILTL